MYPCSECKGRKCHTYFGRFGCPFKRPLSVPKEFSARVEQPFVGQYGYPDVSAGIVHGPRSSGDQDAVIDARLRNIQITRAQNIKTPKEVLQLVALAKKGAQLDIAVTDTKRSVSIERHTALFGARAVYERLNEAENTSFDTHAAKAYYDTDLKASDAIKNLAGNVSDDRIVNLLSTGSLGVDRAMVPTRWSITATDDTISKADLDLVRSFDALTSPVLLLGEHFGNYFYTLLLPGKYSYELIEIFENGNLSSDHELFTGRKTYAHTTAGGYYAARRSIVTHLKEHRIQAKCIAFRLITDEYRFPLGVWVVREAAIPKRIIDFDDTAIAKSFILAHARKHHGADLSGAINHSVLLKQRSITDFSVP